MWVNDSLYRITLLYNLFKPPFRTMASNHSWNLGVMICGVLLIFTGTGMANYFRIIPRRIIFDGQNPTSELNFSCIPSNTQLDYLVGFDMGRKAYDGTQSSLVQGNYGPVESGNITSRSTTLRSSSTVFVKGKTGYLEYILRDLRCSDIAEYYCATTMMGIQNITTTTTTFQTLMVGGTEGFQRDIKMTINPDKQAYDVNTTIEITCSGVISWKIDTDMAKQFVWQLGNKTQTTFPHTDIKIISNGPTPETNCTFNSTMRYKIGPGDDGRQFRCYLKDTEYGANRNISVVGPVGSGNKPGSSIGVFVTSVMLVMFSLS